MSIKAESKTPEIEAFFDHDSNTVSYVVTDVAMKKAAIIDSVLDFDYASGTISYGHADTIIDYVTTRNPDVEWLIETHVHADHLSAAPYIQQKLGGKIGISDRISEVQMVFGKTFNAGTEFERDGSQFDHLFADGDRYKIGKLDGVAIATPGHTPACMVHLIGDAMFVGDTYLCQMVAPRARIFRAVMPARYISLFKRFWHSLMKPEYLFVMIMRRMAVNFYGRQRSGRNAPIISMLVIMSARIVL